MGATAEIAPIGLWVGEVSGNLLLVEGDPKAWRLLTTMNGSEFKWNHPSRVSDLTASLGLYLKPKNERVFRPLALVSRNLLNAQFHFPALAANRSDKATHVRLYKEAALEISLEGVTFEARVDGAYARTFVPAGESANAFLGSERFKHLEIDASLADLGFEFAKGFHEIGTAREYVQCVRDLVEGSITR